MVAMSLLALAALVLVLALLGQPRWQAWRRGRVAAQSFPVAWRRILRRRVPAVARLPFERQQQLKKRMQVFLAETRFIGCAGLDVTEDMRVTVAAQACLLLLGRPEPVFERLREVLLYPGAFVVDRVSPGPAGLQRDERRVLAGESWTRGQVILSWQDVLHGAALPHDGRNVVIHEFAHQLDQATGVANGAPALRSRPMVAQFARVMQAEFDAFCARCEAGEPGLLDPYAATDPAEFFAVASEVFYEQPAELAAERPALYAMLVEAYGVNPAQW